MSIQILIDTAQSRVKTQSVSTLVAGEDWDQALSASDLYFDPATHTLMCRPGFEYPAWMTSNAGIYAKLPLSAFTTYVSGGSPPTLLTHTPNTDGAEFYYLPNNSAGVGGTSTTSFGVNQPMVCEAYAESTTAGSDASIWYGYTPNPGSGLGVFFRLYFDGRAEVWKNSTLVGSYTASGQQKARFNRNVPKKGASTATGAYMGFVIIPCRGREVLVLSSAGTAFTHVFDDILEGTVSPTITPAGPFWWWCPAGVTANVRVAVCQFGPGGNAYSTASKFRFDPGAAPAGGFQSHIEFDANGGTVAPTSAGIAVDGITPTSAYSTNANGVRIGVAIAPGGGGATSPFVYSARAYTLPQYALTPGPGVDISAYVMALSLGASDGNGGTRGRITIKDPIKLAGFGVPKLTIQQNRPIRIFDDGVLVFDGVLVAPKTNEGVIFSATTPGGTSYGQAEGSNPIEHVEFELRDVFWSAAERYRQKEPVPLDGLVLGGAYTGSEAAITAIQMTVREFINPATIQGGYHVSGFGGFVLDHSGDVTTSAFNVINKPTETGSEEVQKLQQNFVANAFVGNDPVNGFRLLAQGDMPTAISATLYDGLESYVAAGGDLDTLTAQMLFRTLDVDSIPAESNDVYVVGWDYRFERPIIAHKDDAAAQDPTVAVALRPNNWSGDVLSYSFETPHITTQATANAACGLLFDRLTNIRAVCEIETDMNSAMQRGQVVKLVFQALPQVFIDLDIPGVLLAENAVLARVKTWDAHVVQGATSGSIERWAPAKYVLQVLDEVADAGNTHTGSLSLAAMKEELHSFAAHRRPQEHDWFQEIIKRPVLLQGEV